MADQNPPVAEAFYAAMNVIASEVVERPIRGLHTVERGEWTLTVNASKEPAEREGVAIGPYNIVAENKVFFALAMFDPTGGMVGGITEDEFIRQMRDLAPEAAG